MNDHEHVMSFIQPHLRSASPDSSSKEASKEPAAASSELYTAALDLLARIVPGDPLWPEARAILRQARRV